MIRATPTSFPISMSRPYLPLESPMICSVALAEEKEIPLWEAFVSRHEEAHNYHQIGWRQVIEESFGHKTYYLIAKDRLGNLVGLLPLVFLKSWIFGKSLVSMPFFNYGGMLTTSAGVDQALLTRACDLAAEIGAGSIELRCEGAKPWEMPVKSRKVSMRLELTESDRLWGGFSSKLRSQIQRPMKEGMEVQWGGEDQLKAFYHVFSINMRDLGTPVYGIRFFETILKVFKDQARICTVYWKGQPVASGFFSSFKDRFEIPWASSLRKFNALSPNMLLYWSALKYAADHGYRVFDFGRSSVGGGAFKFKKQWGAEPVQLNWYYPLSVEGSLPEVNIDNPKYRFAIDVWRRMPVWLTRVLGPKVVRGIA